MKYGNCIMCKVNLTRENLERYLRSNLPPSEKTDFSKYDEEELKKKVIYKIRGLSKVHFDFDKKDSDDYLVFPARFPWQYTKKELGLSFDALKQLFLHFSNTLDRRNEQKDVFCMVYEYEVYYVPLSINLYRIKNITDYVRSLTCGDYSFLCDEDIQETLLTPSLDLLPPNELQIAFQNLVNGNSPFVHMLKLPMVSFTKERTEALKFIPGIVAQFPWCYKGLQAKDVRNIKARIRRLVPTSSRTKTEIFQRTEIVFSNWV